MAVMSISQGEKWVRLLASAYPNAARKGLLSAAMRITRDLQSDPSIPRDRGTLRSGWRCQKLSDGAEIINVAPHFPFVENSVHAERIKVGRKMIAALEEWAKRKKLTLTMKKAGPMTYRAIAWAIAMKMKVRGIFNAPFGLHPLETTMNTRAKGYAKEEIEREVKTAILKGTT
jgi:hypothetical protein